MNIKIIYQSLVVIGFSLYVYSLFVPILLIKEFYIFSNEITIISSLALLRESKEWLLYAIIFVFTILLPVSKYLLLLVYNFGDDENDKSRKIRFILENISKWAMLDVFIVAVLVASVKLKLFTSAETQNGLYYFVGSILISIICVFIQNYSGKVLPE